MPQGDRTGPMGQGPSTGRRLGFCAGFNSPGFANYGFGGGFGRGFRRRRFRSQCTPPFRYNKDEEKKALQEELKEIQNRLKELE